VKKQPNSRSAIESVIEHLESGHLFSRNYWFGVVGDDISVMLAAAGYIFEHF